MLNNDNQYLELKHTAINDNGSLKADHVEYSFTSKYFVVSIYAIIFKNK